MIKVPAPFRIMNRLRRFSGKLKKKNCSGFISFVMLCKATINRQLKSSVRKEIIDTCKYTSRSRDYFGRPRLRISNILAPAPIFRQLLLRLRNTVSIYPYNVVGRHNLFQIIGGSKPI